MLNTVKGGPELKKLLSAVMILILLFLNTDVFAEDINILFMEKALSNLENKNNTLLNMAESEKTAKKQYESAVNSSEGIDTEGISVEFFGKEMYIHFNTNTKMLLTMQKELYPAQMKLSWEMTRDSRKVTLNSMKIGLRGLYLGVYTADNDCKLKQKKNELAQTIYNQSKIKYERGMITSIELSQSEYDSLKAKAAYDAAKRNYENILRSLNSFIGVKLDTAYDQIIYEEIFDETKLKDFDYYTEKALSYRLEVVSALRQISLMEQRKGIYEKYPYTIKLPENKKDYEAMLLELEKQKLMLEKEKIEIEKEIKEAYIEVSVSESNITGLKKVLDLQKNNLENMKSKYEKGLIPKTLLDQIQIGYDETDNGYKAALFDHNTKLMKLEYAAGIGPAY